MNPNKCFLLFLVIIFVGCSKSDDEITSFPVTYRIKELVKIGEPLLYSDGKEIKSISEKEQFLQGEEEYFEKDKIALEQNDWILFKSKDQAEFLGSTETWTVSKEGNRYILTSYDNLVFEKPGDYRDLLHDLAKYSTPSIPISGMKFVKKVVRVVYGNSKQLEMPLFAYKLVHEESRNGSVVSKGYYVGTMLNEFNQGLVSKIRGTEKLAIQRYILRLEAN